MRKLLVGLCTVGLLASSLAQAEEHEWTNKQGKTIKAGFVSAGEEAVTISMGGKSYVVQLADLSPQSRALAAKLRVQKSKAREPQNDKTPPAKTAQDDKINLDDPETLDKIIAEAIDGNKLKKGDKEGERLGYAPNEQTPYTGWAKYMYRNVRKVQNVQSYDTNSTLPDVASEDVAEPMLGQLTQFKAGKVCLEAWWYEKGQKSLVVNVKEGERDGLTIGWYENGQKGGESIFKDGKLISAVAWKPNGEKCPVTNVVNGNGVAVMYNPDGTEKGRMTHKDGEPVKD
jgi:antitoxin component YwqK of YwqJK toxin-antitoxin module